LALSTHAFSKLRSAQHLQQIQDKRRSEHAPLAASLSCCDGRGLLLLLLLLGAMHLQQHPYH
jgi:hypothetical protein